MRKKTNFIKLIQAWGILFLVGLGVSLVAVDVISSYREFNIQSDQMRADFINSRKQLVKQEVDRVVEMIRYEKAQSEQLIKQKIKTRVYEAYAIAQNIYQRNRGAENKPKIQQMILDALRPIRFENGNGYYFAAQLDGIEVLFADRPQMEGLNLLGMQDMRGRYVIKDMIKIVKQSGEGFYEYHWTKPESTGNDFKKISFIKRFEPYDWFIGTGLYVDDVESQIKTHVLSMISRIRFGKEGYIFVNKFNGDALVSNGKLFSGTKKLWEVFNDQPEKMKEVFKKEYDAALKPEGDYIYYSHIKLTSPDKKSPKASFIYGVPELQWIVGAGVYLDDVEADIGLMQAKLNNQVKLKILYYALIIIVIFAVFFLFYFWLNQKLKQDFKLFISFFKRVAYSDEKIDRDSIQFEELDQMAEYTNKMLADRKQAEEAVRENELKFRTLFDFSPQPIALTDMTTGRLIDVNKEFCRRTGFDKPEVIGKTTTELGFYSEAGRKSFIRELSEKGVVSGLEMDFKIKNKSIVSALMFAQKITLRGRALLLTIFVDITQQKKMESRLRQSHKMESIGTLTGGIAHDFNNIMSIIIGNTELAMEDVPESNPAYESLAEIKTAGQRAAGIVKQLLDFSRSTDHALTPVALAPVINESLDFLRSTIPATITIRKQMPDEDTVIPADPVRIRQLMINLCINAFQAMEKTGGELAVGLKKVVLNKAATGIHPDLKPGNYVEISVGDTGPGIDPQIADRIFDPYFTTREFGKGSGMGLAMVHGIVKNHGGAVIVESRPGGGALFKIFFPESKQRPAVDEPSPELPPTGKETILFVDDEESIVKLNTQRLERLHYHIEAETDPEKAYALFCADPNRFDLIVTDMTMPHMTGVALAEKIKAIRPDIPVIICTGYSALIDEETAGRLNIAACLMKPVGKQKLAETIRNVLDGKK